MWWKEGKYDKATQYFCMTSHVFGAKSLACFASFAIICAIYDAIKKGNTSRKNFTLMNFFCSTDTINEAITIAHETTKAVVKRGFRLTKWLSNERKVIESFPTKLKN